MAAWSPPGRSVRPIDPSNRTSPESSIGGTPDSPARRNMTEPRVWPGACSTTKDSPASSSSSPSTQVADVVRLPRRQHAVGHRREQVARLAADARHRVGEQAPVVRVEVRRDASGAADRDDRPHVVDVAVREQDSDRGEPVLADGVLDALDRVLARVDDDALLPRRGRHDPAVGAPRTGGEADDEHGRTPPGGRSTGRRGERPRPAEPTRRPTGARLGTPPYTRPGCWEATPDVTGDAGRVEQQQA